MGGHEGNTESVPMRCVFLITLFSTLYGFIVLNDNWPKTAVELSSNTQLASISAEQSKMLVMLQALDTYYNNEVNVDEHDHDDEHGHDEGHHDEHHEDHEEEHSSTSSDHQDVPKAEERLDKNLLDSPPPTVFEDITDIELEHQAELYEEYLKELDENKGGQGVQDGHDI